MFVPPDAAEPTGPGLLAAQRDLTVHVSAAFPFEKAVDAFTLVEQGHTREKAVIEVTG